MMNMAEVYADIIREYGNEDGAWDSDFLLGCIPDEIVAYALHFHGLAPTFAVARDWVDRFVGCSDDSAADALYKHAMCDAPIDVQSALFAHLCVSIYAQAVMGGAHNEQG